MRRLRALWKALTLHCEEADPLISAQMDQGIGGLDRLGLEGHLLACKSCRRKRAEAGFLRKALRRLAGEAEPEGPPLPAGDRARIVRAIEEG